MTAMHFSSDVRHAWLIISSISAWSCSALQAPHINAIHDEEIRQAHILSSSLSPPRFHPALAEHPDTHACDSLCRQAGAILACMTGHPAPDVAPYTGHTYGENVREISGDFAMAAHEACIDIVALKSEPHFFAKGMYMAYEVIQEGPCKCIARRRALDRGEDEVHLERRKSDGPASEITLADDQEPVRIGVTQRKNTDSSRGARAPTIGHTDASSSQRKYPTSRWQQQIEHLDAESQRMMTLGKERLAASKAAYKQGQYLDCARHASCAIGNVLASDLKYWASVPAAAARIGEIAVEEITRERPNPRDGHDKRSQATSTSDLTVLEEGGSPSAVSPRRGTSLQKRAPVSSLRGSRSLSPIRAPLEGVNVLHNTEPAILSPKNTAEPAMKSGWHSFFSFDKLVAYVSAIGAWLRKFPISIHPPPFDVLIHPEPAIEGAHRGLDGKKSGSPLFRGMPRIWIRTRPDHNHIEARINGQSCRIPLPSMLGRPSSTAAPYFAHSHSSANSRWCNVLNAILGAPAPSSQHSAHPPPYAYPPAYYHRPASPSVSSSEGSYSPSQAAAYASLTHAQTEPPLGYPTRQRKVEHRDVTSPRSQQHAHTDAIDNNFGVPTRYHSGRDEDTTSEYDSGSEW